ncbi:PepSY domain-containing protein [Fulvivirgaceae bacterium PWU4]|uniref:PepSY domain-containing protein n=1 Tax=Chryseosolibacter histidini TaxID=2782349 RepID=A0AAP2DQP8_9BACT|nr:PepSY-associated TM helix domain-containing protein [Chryseosolibacter histidini]MBT1700786.1 PepSY domain-containing protein [Chryseosolibacter histidini]
MKSNRYTLKYWIGKIHLWLGLISGLIVFVIAVTGCIYAFQAEIQDLIQPYRFVTARDQALMPPSALKAIAEEVLPGKKIHAILYAGEGKAAQVIFFSFEPEYYDVVYLDPYTGKILKVKDMEADFFNFILDGHFYLWLPPTIGQPVVATATLVFVAMLVTGIVLWWPKNKSGAKQRFTIKWNARWRRKNYDLHNVLGFYASWIAIILATTGLVWGFEWFANGLHAAAGGEKSLLYVDPVSDTTNTYTGNIPAIDKVWHLMRKEYPAAKVIEVHVPESDSTSIAANANPDDGTYYQTDYRYFDQYTLKELPVDHIYSRYAEASAADKLLRMNYDIHTGAVLGLPGKILAFFASLICASLPVTGVNIYWGRRNKKEAKLKRKAEKRSKKKSGARSQESEGAIQRSKEQPSFAKATAGEGSKETIHVKIEE